MPELPEVEITARRLGAALAGAEVESTLAPGMVAMKTVDPLLSTLEGLRIEGVRRIGKMPVVSSPAGRVAGAAGAPDVGRAPAGVRQARLAQGPPLAGADPARRRARAAPARVRHQAARLGEAAARRAGSQADEMVATLGPEAWPAPPLRRQLAAAVDQPRHLHPLLRDQRAIAGIGRSWVDEILWEAKLAPFRKGAELEREEVEPPARRARRARRRRSTTTRR